MKDCNVGCKLICASPVSQSFVVFQNARNHLTAVPFQTSIQRNTFISQYKKFGQSLSVSHQIRLESLQAPVTKSCDNILPCKSVCYFLLWCCLCWRAGKVRRRGFLTIFPPLQTVISTQQRGRTTSAQRNQQGLLNHICPLFTETFHSELTTDSALHIPRQNLWRVQIKLMILVLWM